MSKQFRIGLIVALAMFFAFPVDAMGGGFGIFKHCRSKQQTCCPPPVCAPLVCAPTACAPCEIETKEPVKTHCWIATASGMDMNQNYGEYQGDCVEDANDAIDSAFANVPGGFAVYSVEVEECVCTDVTPKTQPGDQNADQTGRNHWRGKWTGCCVCADNTVTSRFPHSNGRNLVKFLIGRDHPKKIILERVDL